MSVWTKIRGDLRRHGLRSGGFWALFMYRYGRWGLERPSAEARWWNSKVYGLCRPFAQLITGVDLDRHTQLGEDFHIVHGGMVQIHPLVVIGDRVGIMHGVTLGTNMGDGVPTIGNDVFIGCHASVLGRVTIGDGARIAANSLVIADVPKGAVAIGVPARAGPDLSTLRKESGRAAPDQLSSPLTKDEASRG